MAPAGLFYRAMPEEPPVKRAVAFFDGQNLYHHAKAAFGHYHPNFDPIKLSDVICKQQGWQPTGVRFYTGVPDSSRDPYWHGFWTRKLLALRRSGVLVVHRTLRYRIIEVSDDHGEVRRVEVAQEKGIDVRLALDVVRLASTNQLDVALIFSQDQDLAEIADDIREICRVQSRWIKVASAFPSGPNASAYRGIDKTDWIRISQALYDSCIDPRDYRSRT